MPKRKAPAHPERPVRSDASVIQKSRFDWCHHSEHQKCKKSFQRYHFVANNPKPVYLDEFVDCDCKCHTKGKK